MLNTSLMMEQTGKQIPVGLAALSLYGLTYFGQKAYNGAGTI